MKNFFDQDGWLYQGLTILANLLILNFLTILACIPVITIGAALTALSKISLDIARKQEGYIARSYWKAFRENLRGATILWLIWAVIAALFFLDIRVLGLYPGLFPPFLKYVVTAAGLVAFMIFQYIFPLQSHFENTIRGTIRNAALLAIANLPKTIVMCAVWIVPIWILRNAVVLWPLLIMFGFSGPAWVCAVLYSGIFKKFEPADGEDTGEGIQ